MNRHRSGRTRSPRRRLVLEGLEQRRLLATFELSALAAGDGTAGFVLNGIASGDQSGTAVKLAGDVNGDGLDDIVTGAFFADDRGEAYVVFGRDGGFPEEVELLSLDGSNGFRVPALADGDRMGWAVDSAGDINGDGLDDLFFSSYQHDPQARDGAGQAYVVFGKQSGFPAQLDLDELTGADGFAISGRTQKDYLGFSLSLAGDVNGDGYGDIITGAVGVTNRVYDGEAYVIYGRPDAFPAALDVADLNGSNGFIIDGPDVGTGVTDQGHRVGQSVSDAGDVNGDGLGDLVIGTIWKEPGAEFRGRSFVVFGRAEGMPERLDVTQLDGSDGFAIHGVEPGDGAGRSGVSAAGDVNGDGFDDLLISAPTADPRDDSNAGESYVVFGKESGFDAVLELSSLDGSNGFTLRGIDPEDRSGAYVSDAGDFNGDGYGDILIGASTGDPGGRTSAGEVYLVLGSAAAASVLELSTLAASTSGLVLNGIDNQDFAGPVGGTGDVNGDGFDDIVIGSRRADPNGSSSGETYVVYGHDLDGSVTHLGDEQDNLLTGAASDDVMVGGRGDDTLVGSGGADVLRGGAGDDVLAVADASFARIVGGNGFDTLRVDGADVTLDLTALRDNRILGVEQIDSSSAANTTIRLSLLDVLNLSDHSNTLLVRAHVDDTVDRGDGWENAGSETIGGVDFTVFTQGAATLKIAGVREPADIVVTESGGSTSVEESGTTDALHVSLASRPDSNVVVEIASSDTSEATVSTTALTFTPGNWNTPQTVVVTGVDDLVDDGDQVAAITLSVNDANSDDYYDDVEDKTIAATTVDDDVAGFTIVESDGGTSVDEAGGEDSFTVALTSQPLSDVVLTVVSGDEGEATVSAASLTFTAANWNTAQTVTVAGVDDQVDDGDQTTLVTISVDDDSSDDAFDPLGNQSVGVTTVDDDAAGFTIVETDGGTSVDESGSEDSFTVVLTSQPLSDVVLTVVSGDEGEATVSVSSLTFTAANWNTAQTVTVAGVDDQVDDGDQATLVTISVDDDNSDDAFDPLGNQSVGVTTVDDDVAGFTIVETDGGTSVDESGGADSFTVVLNSQPLSDVVLTVVSGDEGEATVSVSSLTFTAANWNTAQTVTVAGVDEQVDDGDQATLVAISVDDDNSDDAFDPLVSQSVTVTTVDDDVAGFAVVESDGGTSVDESGGEDSFTVVLNSQPLSDVVLTVVSGDEGEAAVSAALLTFTSANWATAQTVTVTGVDDQVDDGDQTTLVTISVDDDSSDDAFDSLGNQSVTVTTVDDDAAGFAVVESDGATSVGEAGGTDSFTVALTAQPLSDVVLTVVSGDEGEAAVSAALLTFTSANWATAQTVTVTGVDDQVDDGDQTTLVTVSVDGDSSDDAFDELPSQNVTVTTVDDDGAGFTIVESNGGTSVSETGGADSFDVVLASQPLSDVVLTVVSDDESEVAVSAATLTFTAANWDTAQTITVTGVDEQVDDGDRTTLVIISVDDESSDDAYDALASQSVAVTTIDDDVAGLAIVESDGGTTVSEAGQQDTFTVVLTSQPLSDVVLTVVSDDESEATVSAASLTFTAANWSAAQTVTVTAVDDVAGDGNTTTLVTISVDDDSSDSTYDDVADQAVSVTTIDNDNAGFAIAESGGGTSVEESGTSDDFTVVLTSQPLSNVVLTINSGDPSEAAAAPASLTFTPTNWDIAQAVIVTGVDEQIDDGDQITPVTISVDDQNSDDTYDALPSQMVTVTTVDDDAAGFTIVESGGGTSVGEAGGEDSFTVALTAQPLSDVVLTVVSDDEGEAVVSAASLTFTASNWAAAQLVTVTGVDELIDDGDQSTLITIAVDDASSDDAFDSLPSQTVPVATVDDDVAGFTIVETDGETSVSEAGTTDTVLVALDAQPTSDVVLTLSIDDVTEATVAPAALTFTPVNWDAVQSVVVQGVDDGQPDGSQVVALVVSVDGPLSDDSYDSVADQSVTVQVSENQAPVVSGLQDQTSDEDQPLVVNVQVSDVDHLAADLQLSVVSGDAELLSQAGIQVAGDDGMRQVTLTPSADASGALMVTLRVEDGAGAFSETAFLWTILPVNDAPVVANAAEDATVQAFDRFQITLPAGMFTDPDGDDLEVTAALPGGGVLPAWLNFDADTMQLSGMAEAAAEGRHTIRIRAVDAGAPPLQAFQDVAIIVSPNPAPWHNHGFAEDVNDDGIVTPEDLVLILGWMIASGPTPRVGGPGFPPQYMDVIPDDLITSQDLLAVLSYIVIRDSGGGEAEPAAASRPQHHDSAGSAGGMAEGLGDRGAQAIEQLPARQQQRLFRRFDNPQWESLLSTLAEEQLRKRRRGQLR